MSNIEAVYFSPQILQLTENPMLLKAQLTGLSPDISSEDLSSGINTDIIIPSDACKSPDPEILAEFVLTGWKNGTIGSGDIKKFCPNVLVAGSAFGSGSSREHAPIALNRAGINIIIAPSFSPIFRRNTTNIGLYTSTDFSLLTDIQNGNPIPLDTLVSELDPLSQDILRSGGLLPYLKLVETGVVKAPEIKTEKRPMTIAEKWLAQYFNVPFVKPGDGGFIQPNSAYTYEYTAPLSIAQLREIQKEVSIFNPEQLVFFNDHLPLDTDTRAINLEQITREFAQQQGITIFDTTISPSEMGICHIIMLEKVNPGINVGTDSHTSMIAPLGGYVFGIGATDYAGLMYTGKVLATVPESIRINLSGCLSKGITARDLMLYLSAMDKQHPQFLNRVMEFGGSALTGFSTEQLAVIANASAECRAVTAVFEPTAKNADYLVRTGRAESFNEALALFPQPDLEAQYHNLVNFDLGSIEPIIAFPGSPDNGKPLSQTEPFTINKVIIGACVGGGIEDIKIVARLLIDNKVCRNIALIVHPHSYAVLKIAENQGWLKIIESAGGKIIRDIGCGECVGNGPAFLQAKDVALTNESRNHTGRMGHPDAKINLASSVICTISAILGRTPTLKEFQQYSANLV